MAREQDPDPTRDHPPEDDAGLSSNEQAVLSILDDAKAKLSNLREAYESLKEKSSARGRLADMPEVHLVQHEAAIPKNIDNVSEIVTHGEEEEENPRPRSRVKQVQDDYIKKLRGNFASKAELEALNISEEATLSSIRSANKNIASIRDGARELKTEMAQLQASIEANTEEMDQYIKQWLGPR